MNIFTVYFQLRRAVSPLPTALPTMHPGHTRGAGFPFNPSPLFCLNTFPLFLSPPITSLLVYLLESSPPPLLKPSPSLSLSLSLSANKGLSASLKLSHLFSLVFHTNLVLSPHSKHFSLPPIPLPYLTYVSRPCPVKHIREDVN